MLSHCLEAKLDPEGLRGVVLLNVKPLIGAGAPGNSVQCSSVQEGMLESGGREGEPTPGMMEIPGRGT